MPTEIPDIDLKLVWNRTKDGLKVFGPDNTLLYNSWVGVVDPGLSERQLKWITEHYNQKRMKYVFA